MSSESSDIPKPASNASWWKNGCLVIIALPLIIMVGMAWYEHRSDREEQQRQVEAYERQQEETRRLRAEMERRCDELVAMVKRGPTSPSGPTSTLEDRLVQRHLKPDDFKLQATDLPCSDTATRREVLWNGFVAAATNSLDRKSLAWMTDDLFEAVKTAKLAEERSAALTQQVEEHASERLKEKEVRSLEDVLLVCERAAALTGADHPGAHCKAAARRQKIVERRLETEAKKEEARRKRDQAAEAARERAAGACAERCDRTYPNMGPRWDACNNNASACPRHCSE